MATKIEQKIVGYKVLTKETPPVNPPAVHENLTRPEVLFGSTYKIKPPHMDTAVYVTINDYELNGKRYPYEVFLNSKNMEHFQWVSALTRLISAVFRKGGDVTFLVTELKEVFDPRGGYFRKGGKFINSLVAEIGYVIEDHMRYIGLLEPVKTHDAKEFPDTAVLCPKCSTKSVVIMDGCKTCLNCGDSKCGT